MNSSLFVALITNGKLVTATTRTGVSLSLKIS